MRRRTVLAGLATGVTAGLAGCSTQSSDPESTDTSSPTTTTDQTTPQSTAAAGPSSDNVYKFRRNALVRDNKLSAQVNYYATRSSVPYYSPESESVRSLQPSDGRFVSATFNFYNRGGESLQKPSYQPFSAWVNGESYSQLQELPDSVEWSQLRQGNLEYSFLNPWWVDAYNQDQIQPDETVYPSFLFSIPDVDMSRVYIQWSPDFLDESVYFQLSSDETSQGLAGVEN